MRIAAIMLAGMVLATGVRLGGEELVRLDRRTIEVGGVEREFLLHVPKNQNAIKPMALILVFHGGGGLAAQMERLIRFDLLADREGFLVAYPQGSGRNWNDGRMARGIPAQRKNVDDLAFVEAIIDTLSREHKVDAKRIYATGLSNGGIFSHDLGARLSKRIAAIAPVVGGMPEPVSENFKPDEPVSVLVIQGTADPIMPFDGGEVAENDGKARRGKIVSTDQALALWVRRDGCGGKAVVESLADRDPADGCRVTRSTWKGGQNGTEVVYYRVEGGGHTWPGGPQYLPERVIGKVCRDFDATATIWEFFKAHPKP